MQVVYICTVGSFFLGVLRCQIIKVNHTVYSPKKLEFSLDNSPLPKIDGIVPQ